MAGPRSKNQSVPAALGFTVGVIYILCLLTSAVAPAEPFRLLILGAHAPALLIWFVVQTDGGSSRRYERWRRRVHVVGLLLTCAMAGCAIWYSDMVPRRGMAFFPEVHLYFYPVVFWVAWVQALVWVGTFVLAAELVSPSEAGRVARGGEDAPDEDRV